MAVDLSGIADLVRRISQDADKHALDLYEGKYAKSMTGRLARTGITGRCYIEDTLINEDFMPDVMKLTNQMYLGFIIATVKLNLVFDRYEHVRSAIRSISNQSFDEVAFIKAIDEGVSINEEGEMTVNVDVEKSVKHLISHQVVEFSIDDMAVVSEKTGYKEDHGNEFSEKNTIGSKGTGLETEDKLKSSNTTSKEMTKGPRTVTFPIHVTMLPMAVTSNVAEAILDLNFTHSTGRRWKMVKAGELSFWKDFVLARDLVAKYAKAIKNDKNNILKGMKARKVVDDTKWMASIKAKSNYNNAASSVLFFDKKTFDQGAHNAGYDFTNENSRQKFFSSSAALIVAVVDTVYESITFYYNGMSGYAEVPLRAVKRSGGNPESGFSLDEIMKAIGAGNAPKY